MNRFLALGLILAFLVGCNGGGENPGTVGPTPVTPTPIPDIKKTPQWGDLECQKKQNCQDPILLMDLDLLTNFLGQWPLDQQNSRVGRKSFACGIEFAELWGESFKQISDFEVHDFEKIMNFALYSIHPTSCLLKNEKKIILKKYFENTEEYKNEVQ